MVININSGEVKREETVTFEGDEERYTSTNRDYSHIVRSVFYFTFNFTNNIYALVQGDIRYDYTRSKYHSVYDNRVEEGNTESKTFGLGNLILGAGISF